MLTLLIVMAALLVIIGIVYPVVMVAALRIMGDRRPLRELLEEI